MTSTGFKIATTSTFDNVDFADSYVARLTGRHSLTALITMIDDARQFCELRMTQSAWIGEGDANSWVKVVEEVEAKLDAVVSLWRNSQLDTFLSFGLLFTFTTPDGSIAIELSENRPGR